MSVLGLLLIFFGGAAMDSPNQFIPAVMVFAGMALMLIGARRWN